MEARGTILWFTSEPIGQALNSRNIESEDRMRTHGQRARYLEAEKADMGNLFLPPYAGAMIERTVHF